MQYAIFFEGFAEKDNKVGSVHYSSLVHCALIDHVNSSY